MTALFRHIIKVHLNGALPDVKFVVEFSLNGD
ncbi:hypothetical protein L247_24760 [Salmonella enterica subsp. enterica serovar Worthington str. BCH-7253]|nr:hypothetical protein L247_24760 [Salmonella enterica subsp. enterica serovar Worthington str. BCH-7253]